MTEASGHRIALSPGLSVDAWVALLDSIEDGLRADVPVLVDTLPPDPGPVPPVLVDRVRGTLQRVADAQAALEHRRNEIGRELVALSALKANARRTSSSTVPYFLDTKA